jgi:hypothetical protein
MLKIRSYPFLLDKEVIYVEDKELSISSCCYSVDKRKAVVAYPVEKEVTYLEDKQLPFPSVAVLWRSSCRRVRVVDPVETEVILS